MNARNSLITLFVVMILAMINLVVVTSLKSNLFEVWQPLSQEPWFVTTLFDFYFNIVILSAWVIYKERNLLLAAGWIIGFITLGSIATLLYVVIQLVFLKPNEPISQILLRKKI